MSFITKSAQEVPIPIKDESVDVGCLVAEIAPVKGGVFRDTDQRDSEISQLHGGVLHDVSFFWSRFTSANSMAASSSSSAICDSSLNDESLGLFRLMAV